MTSKPTLNPYEVVPFDPAWLDDEGLMTNALDHTGVLPCEPPFVKLGYQFLSREQAETLNLLDAEGYVRPQLESPQLRYLASIAASPDDCLAMGRPGGQPPAFEITPYLVTQDLCWVARGYQLNAVAEIRHNCLHIYAKDNRGQRIHSPTALIDRRALFYFEGKLAWGSIGNHAKKQYDIPQLRRVQDWTPVYQVDLYKAVYNCADDLRRAYRTQESSDLAETLSIFSRSREADQEFPRKYRRPTAATVDDILFYHVFDSCVMRLKNLVESPERLLAQLLKMVNALAHDKSSTPMRAFFAAGNTSSPLHMDAYAVRNWVMAQAREGKFPLAGPA